MALQGTTGDAGGVASLPLHRYILRPPLIFPYFVVASVTPMLPALCRIASGRLLLQLSKLAVEKGQTQGRDESYVKQLADDIIPTLVDALQKEPEVEICASMLDSLNECMHLAGLLLSENQVRSIVDQLKHVITASVARKKETAERTKAEDFDAEEEEMLKEENEQVAEVFDQVVNEAHESIPISDYFSDSNL
ncbi:HEAT domain-containing protein [Canna indica]|uniref:HEAT domain-containing protein n=1 Tax=Canna indica TaxID=4628 RepID=A0AAQ3Q9U7_9LILI|nr:HEAT domain-containing protein [Canna indica]